MLQFFKNKFDQSSKKTKIELYLLPILILFLAFLTFYNQDEIENKHSVDFELIEKENKKFDKNSLDLLNTIEILAKDSEIFIQKIHNFKEKITLQAKSNDEKLINFLNDIENLNSFTKIESLNIKNLEDSNFLFDLNIDFSKYFIKEPKEKKQKIEKYIKNLDQEKKNSNEIIKKPEFTINAIIANYAFINNKWIEQDGFIEGYKLDFISRNYVLLKKEDDIIKLEVNSIEHLKNRP